MIVAGYTVPAEVEAALVERMRSWPWFSAGMLAEEAEKLDPFMPGGAYDGLANRLIQRERKAGNITVNDRAWS